MGEINLNHSSKKRAKKSLSRSQLEEASKAWQTLEGSLTPEQTRSLLTLLRLNDQISLTRWLTSMEVRQSSSASRPSESTEAGSATRTTGEIGALPIYVSGSPTWWNEAQGKYCSPPL